eukprot:4331602-Alexandrium_andersonii.AAC.1
MAEHDAAPLVAERDALHRGECDLVGDDAALGATRMPPAPTTWDLYRGCKAAQTFCSPKKPNGGWDWSGRVG